MSKSMVLSVLVGVMLALVGSLVLGYLESKTPQTVTILNHDRLTRFQ